MGHLQEVESAHVRIGACSQLAGSGERRQLRALVPSLAGDALTNRVPRAGTSSPTMNDE